MLNNSILTLLTQIAGHAAGYELCHQVSDAPRGVFQVIRG